MITNKLIQLFLISSIFACKDDVQIQDGCQYNGCDLKRQTIKLADNAAGRINVLSKHPDTWVIVSEEGIIGEDGPIYDGPDIVVICNLPDSLKVIGLQVIFSGELKDSCGDFDTWVSKNYYCSPSQITINHQNNQS